MTLLGCGRSSSRHSSFTSAGNSGGLANAGKPPATRQNTATDSVRNDMSQGLHSQEETRRAHRRRAGRLVTDSKRPGKIKDAAHGLADDPCRPEAPMGHNGRPHGHKHLFPADLVAANVTDHHLSESV